MFFDQGYRQERCRKSEKAQYEEPTAEETDHEMHESRGGLEVNILQQTRNFC